MMIQRIIAVIITAAMLFAFLLPVAAEDAEAAVEYGKTVEAKSALLIEAESGRVLFEQNADEGLIPASVTKTMTMLLVFEALDSGKIALTDEVSVSENAAGMGGSQVYLEPGEKMTVDKMLKSMVVASANDAAVALAEFVCGSEEAFVAAMNKRANELGCKNTHFENPTGLDDTAENHIMSARDIALITREVIKHKKVYDYSTIWMDTVRGGAFGLTNTNRLIRFYKGATGLKTGSTSKAKFCISATACRDGLTLIAVIMASPTRDSRNAAASSLFDYGFANYSMYTDAEEEFPDIYAEGGRSKSIKAKKLPFGVVVSKGKAGEIKKVYDVPEKVKSPVTEGEKIGSVTYTLDGEVLGTADILCTSGTEKIDYFTLLLRLVRWFLCSGNKE